MIESLVDSNGYINDPYRNFIATSRYAKWQDDKGRRENWIETVDRYMEYMRMYLQKNADYEVAQYEYEELRQAIIDMKVLPSMRAIMTAGIALDSTNIAAYNCSFIPVDSLNSFDEAMFILMCGTGVGFSVERRYTEQLPSVPEQTMWAPTYLVADSREGWATSLRTLIHGLYRGMEYDFDYSSVRPAGAPLKTFGGRASGPEPLMALHEFVKQIFRAAAGRKLTPLECNDIMCKIGEVVIAGSVRRSALISLSDLEDSEMSSAKQGEFWQSAPERSMANLSAVYDGTPSREVFDAEWQALVASGSGERGIFNREASKIQAAKYGHREYDIDYGTNPCSEIILRPYQFCNLTTIPVSGTESIDELAEKVRYATILGTWQAAITKFHYLNDKWQRNTEEERLLGVSMTGIYGHPVLNGSQGTDVLEDWLVYLRKHARKVNWYHATDIGINVAGAITCIKPEGNSSQLTATSSGIHPWHSKFYIRTVRGDKNDSLGKFLKDSGVPCEDDLMKPTTGDVFSFPIKAPEDAITRDEVTAIEHLELWLAYQRFWCEHKPSITVSVKPEEWEEVGNWVYDHFDEVSGIAFLPYSDHVYAQAPYQPISEAEYDDAVAKMPKIQWEMLSLYESEDRTTGSKELNCSAGSCDIMDMSATMYAEPMTASASMGNHRMSANGNND